MKYNLDFHSTLKMGIIKNNHSAFKISVEITNRKNLSKANGLRHVFRSRLKGSDDWLQHVQNSGHWTIQLTFTEEGLTNFDLETEFLCCSKDESGITKRTLTFH